MNPDLSLWGTAEAAPRARPLPFAATGRLSRGDAEPVSIASNLMKRWPASSAHHEVVLVTSGIDPLGGGNKAGFQPVRFNTEVPNAEIVAASKVYVPAGR